MKPQDGGRHVWSTHSNDIVVKLSIVTTVDQLAVPLYCFNQQAHVMTLQNTIVWFAVVLLSSSDQQIDYKNIVLQRSLQHDLCPRII
jgi:hypothetical protein